ncbi:kinesin light chain p46822 [Diplodia corticola]|uniref:Kinesin light chain p46822 n=1 Tax=Diplodia corticola TaxID=236234 RepID=A0A1J9RHR2_9PEZI|nr:kinesin light chain p46822 [Diplodia corticola]OJD32091.1 kinesin light chain p46822 [Diplodia corticola]
MSERSKVLTYRVRQLPLEIDKAGVSTLLQRCLQAGGSLPEVHVYSLARSLASLYTSRTKTATVTIKPLPPHLQGREGWSFWTDYQGARYNIIIDLDFLDFTVLNDVRDEEHAFDCISISGLGSHPFGSWQHRGETPFMWLRDGIPEDFPGSRSIIYGYGSQVPDSSSFQRPHDIAARLVNRLRSVGFGSSQSRPVILLAHSLGGIILKEALIILAGISDQEYSFLGNLKLVIFFGVPHKGMSTSRLVTMVQGNPNEDLIRDLSPNSSYLRHVEERFNGVHTRRGFRVVSFYETKTTKTVQQQNDGKWLRTGPPTRMVDRESAIQRCSRDPEDIYSIDEDHSAMVKFFRDDVNYRCVRDCLAGVSSVVGVDFAEKLVNSAGLLAQKRTRRGRDHSTNAAPSAGSMMPECSFILAITSSLRLQMLDRRLAEITHPYQSTFGWIFRDDALGFSAWLLKGQGGYWIRGKPGSGKSTLMKHIAYHENTHQFLDKWTYPARLVKAGFFFYYRGSRIQKSFDGLIRSVLLRILEEVPELCQYIPSKCLPLPGKTNFDWSPGNLYDALRSVLEQRRMRLKICLFIDALDEFDGHLEILADFIETLIEGGCKVCFSSRPRDILQKHFGSLPGIDMQDYTEADIQSYTWGRLTSFADVLTGVRDTVHSAVVAITRKANGVFLWVKLVLDRIEQEGISSDRISTLLHQVPEELEDFYATIIERIPDEFRWEIYLTLDVMLRAREEPFLPQIFWIVKWAQCYTLGECFEKLQEEDDFLGFCHRLKERCGGLIEIAEPFNTRTRIRLIHETVREFVGGPGFQELMVGRAALFRAQNGYTELAKLYLAALRFPSNVKIETHAYGLTEMCMLYCHLAESTTGVCQSQLIDALQPDDFANVASTARSVACVDNDGTHIKDIPVCPTSAIGFAVSSGLLIYMQQKLGHGDTSDTMIEEALHAVVQIVKNLQRHKWRLWDKDAPPDHHQMARLLLEAPGKSHYLGATAFGSLFLNQSGTDGFAYANQAFLAIGQYHDSKSILDLARLFLSNGQDANMELTEESRFAVGRCGNPRGPKPLHLAVNKMAELLLSYNAEINATDREGRTPLDAAIKRLVVGWLFIPDKVTTTASEEHIDMLMGEGACITQAGLRFYPLCVDIFTNSGRDIQGLLELPRRYRGLSWGFADWQESHFGVEMITVEDWTLR